MNHVRRSLTELFRLLVLSLIGITILGTDSGTSAAPPKSKGSAEKSEAVKDTVVEKPSLPFLTLMLARDPSVHEELDLSPTQLDKVNAAIASVDQPLWLLRDIPVEKSGTQASALLDQLRNQLKSTLKKAQLDRLDQLVLQARGTKALVTPEVSQRLKLTTSQVSQLKKVLADSAAALEPSKKDDAKPARSQDEVNKAEIKRVNDVLNAKQTTSLSNLLGKPFNFGRVQQIGCVAPEIRDVQTWINSDPLTLEKLRGKVVVVHFWAFGCINCIRNLPHYQSWYEKFPQDEVTIIGFQTPETESESNLDNLQRNVRERKIQYPVAFDLNRPNWNAWANNMWPSVYLIDKRGQVRNWWYGELNWQGGNGEEFMRKKIEQLIAEPD